MTNLVDLTFASTATLTFIEEIGRGGMGIVYLAEKHCEGVSDLLVLKTIRNLTDKQVESIKREANVAGSLRHENIVRSYGLESVPLSKLPEEFLAELNDFRVSGLSKNRSRGRALMDDIRAGKVREERGDNTVIADKLRTRGKRLFLLVMDYVEGWDLRNIHANHVQQGLLMPPAISAFAISRICRALDYAHEFIVHRDISPENILINNQGVAKLTDFGIAVAADTQVKEIAGKIQYMAPEQIHGENVDNRSDIFALGLVAYQLVTGISLFFPRPGMSFREQAAYYDKLLERKIIPPHKVVKDCPEEYSEIIMRMLEVNPQDRYQSIGDTSSDMEKKYLYAKGFGPTNNSLGAYLKILDSGFKDYTKQDLHQLSFLADEKKRLHLKRKVSRDLYTDTGFKVLQQRKANSILNQI